MQPFKIVCSGVEKPFFPFHGDGMPQNVFGLQISEIFISFCENHYVTSSTAKKKRKKKVCNGTHKPQVIIIPSSLIYHSLISFYRSTSARLVKISNELLSLIFLSASVSRQEKQIYNYLLFILVWANCLLEFKCTFC